MNMTRRLLLASVLVLLAGLPSTAMQLNCSGGCSGVTGVTANQIVVGTATNTLGSTASISVNSGGTGIDTSASAGLPYLATTGVWTVNTTQTPQVARLGLGAAANGTYQLNLGGALLNGITSNVGLGTTTPASNFHIYGTSLSDMRLQATAASGSGIVTIVSLDSASVSETWKAGTNVGLSNNDYELYATVSGGGGSRLRISPGGRIFMRYVATASVATAADACFNGSGANQELVLDTALCVVSARRFKHDIEDWQPDPKYKSAMDELAALRVVNYKLNEPANADQGREQTGLVAEDVEQVDKRFVTYQADGQIRSVLYLQMIPMLEKAVQELDAKKNPSRLRKLLPW